MASKREAGFQISNKKLTPAEQEESERDHADIPVMATAAQMASRK